MEMTYQEKLYRAIITKAHKDLDFKKSLITSPIDTIETFIGYRLNIPKGKNLVINDQSDDSVIYMNIPSKQQVDTELDEQQIETVVGGNFNSNMLGSDYVGSILPHGPLIPVFPVEPPSLTGEIRLK